jgi:hypothetical protein
MMPAFSSPALTSTRPKFAVAPFFSVGNPLRSGRVFLYEQCSDHITEKIPSSVSVGSRPRCPRTCSYSSGSSPCFLTRAGVIGWLRSGSGFGGRAAGFMRTFGPSPETSRKARPS